MRDAMVVVRQSLIDKGRDSTKMRESKVLDDNQVTDIMEELKYEDP